MIIGRRLFNALEAALSTLYLTMKYPLDVGHIWVIKGYQGLSKKFYKDILKMKKAQQDNPKTENPLR